MSADGDLRPVALHPLNARYWDIGGTALASRTCCETHPASQSCRHHLAGGGQRGSRVGLPEAVVLVQRVAQRFGEVFASFAANPRLRVSRSPEVEKLALISGQDLRTLRYVLDHISMWVTQLSALHLLAAREACARDIVPYASQAERTVRPQDCVGFFLLGHYGHQGVRTPCVLSVSSCNDRSKD
jgi:hypothetical protein